MSDETKTETTEVTEVKTETEVAPETKTEETVPLSKYLEADRELKALKKAQDDAELEKMDELKKTQTKLERATAERDELSRKLLQTVQQSAVRDEARALGFQNPEDAIKLAEFEADADPDKIKEAVKALADERPYLLVSSSPEGAGSAMSRGQTSVSKNSADLNIDKFFAR